MFYKMTIAKVIKLIIELLLKKEAGIEISAGLQLILCSIISTPLVCSQAHILQKILQCCNIL